MCTHYWIVETPIKDQRPKSVCKHCGKCKSNIQRFNPFVINATHNGFRSRVEAMKDHMGMVYAYKQNADTTRLR